MFDFEGTLYGQALKMHDVLVPGTIVRARFTNCGHCYEFKGKIHRVFNTLIRVEALENFRAGNLHEVRARPHLFDERGRHHDAGRIFKIASVHSREWSANNRIVEILPAEIEVQVLAS